MVDNDPVLVLELPRSVAITAVAALRKLPLEQVEVAHATLVGAIQRADQTLLMLSIEQQLKAERQEPLPGS